MAYVAMLPLLLHPPVFRCKDYPGERDAERPEGESEFELAKRGLPLPLDRFPRQATLVSSHRTLNDVIFAMSMKWAVSDRVRDIFEAIAPDQVEYIPVDLTRKNAKPVSDLRYYYINIRHGLETILWDRVKFSHKVYPNGWREVDTLVLNTIAGWDLGLQVDRKGHQDIKIWYERGAGGISEWMFMSDDIAEALAQAAVTGPLFAYVQEEARQLDG